MRRALPPGGSKFLGHVPLIGAGTTRIVWAFATLVQAFGAYVTGLESLNSDLVVSFNDGSVQQIEFAGNPAGGAAFIGFTDAGRPISSIEYRVDEVQGPRDIFSIDDVRFVTVPSPASAMALLMAPLVNRRRR